VPAFVDSVLTTAIPRSSPSSTRLKSSRSSEATNHFRVVAKPLDAATTNTYGIQMRIFLLLFQRSKRTDSVFRISLDVISAGRWLVTVNFDSPEEDVGIDRNSADLVEVRRTLDQRDRYSSEDELRRLKLLVLPPVGPCQQFVVDSDSWVKIIWTTEDLLKWRRAAASRTEYSVVTDRAPANALAAK
jgi:hypothetical protein